jgi:hypothetical protein
VINNQNDQNNAKQQMMQRPQTHQINQRQGQSQRMYEQA